MLAVAPTPAVTPVAAGAGAAAIVVVVELAHPQVAHADNIWLHSCAFYGNDDVGHGVWLAQQAYAPDAAFSDTDNCGSGAAFGVHTTQSAWGGHWEQWLTVAPAGISIDSAWTPPCTWSNNCQFGTWHGTLINCRLESYGYTAWYVWGSSGSPSKIVNHDGGNCYSDGLADGTPINTSFPPTNYFGFQLRCSEPSNKTCPALTPGVGLTGVQVGATETRAPSIGPASASASILFNHNGGWVRGQGFDFGIAGWDPSGLCDMRAWLNGQLIQGPTTGLDQSVWDQCDDTGGSQQWAGPTINTAQYADGTALQLTYQADNAAGAWATSTTSTVRVDNSAVALSLTAPADQPVTAGAADVTATSSANPSGDTIFCQADGGAWTAHPGTSARIPVSGLGDHSVSCYSQSSAEDSNGQPARSPMETRSLKIDEPVHGGISFRKLTPDCRRVHRRVRIPARWVTVRRGHKRVRVHKRAKTRLEWVTVCRAPRHLPRVAHVAFGRATAVYGWFATADGTALSHVPVTIIVAPNRSGHRWHTVEVVTTDSRGDWRATLGPGPSRLIEAVYAGAPLTEAALSPLATVAVPARIDVSIGPRSVAWSGSVTISGRLRGGYIPADGVALRLLIRYPGSQRPTDLLGFRTTRRGTFRIRYTFGSGHGVATYPLWVATTATESDYPYASAASRSILITFG